jgi:hypothetical protein
VFRSARTALPWWSSVALSSDYVGQPPIHPDGWSVSSRFDIRFETGIKARARLYNAFLQGQFRHSDVTYDSSQLQRLLFEAWAGVEFVLKNRLDISYTIRHQTDEIRRGTGARAFTWAGIAVSQGF